MADEEYSVFYLPQFKKEFAQFPEYQQDKVLDFTDIFEANGLTDFSLYEGKISPSWSGIDDSHPNYSYAKINKLWHYHVGLPEYTQIHPAYKTSDVVLHFQWEHGGNEINLVDLYSHYTQDGEFYLPSLTYLAK